MGGMAMVFALASLGLPGLGNFVGEFLVLIGAFKASPGIAAVSALGLVLAAAYSLWFMRRAFFGPSAEDWRLPDLSGRETLVMAVLVAVIVFLGVFPQPVLTAARPSLKTTVPYKQSAFTTIQVRRGNPGCCRGAGFPACQCGNAHNDGLESPSHDFLKSPPIVLISSKTERFPVLSMYPVEQPAASSEWLPREVVSSHVPEGLPCP